MGCGGAGDGADKVFGPATTTRHVYDVAAQHVVCGAMEGINGNYINLITFNWVLDIYLFCWNFVVRCLEYE